ncbi:ATP-binding protein [Desulfobulbus sp. F5]|nr:ATP-binding protein [Desulfobulbus sp. F5]
MPLSEEKAFPVSLDALKDMRDYVATAAAGLPIDKKKLYKLQLAVDEIATNIILYSGLNEEDAKIFMACEIKKNSLIIQLRDQGVPFDPRHKLEMEKACLSKPTEERRIGGLGIYLAITGVDEFRYEYMDGFNVNCLNVNFC